MELCPLDRSFIPRAGVPALIVLAAAPFLIYPLFAAQVLCYCLFACAFNLLLGTSGLLSFGHAAFFGSAGCIAGHALKVWGLPFELAALPGMLTAACCSARAWSASYSGCGSKWR